MDIKYVWSTMVGATILGVLTPAFAGPAETESFIGLYVSNLAGSGPTFGQRFPSGFGYHLSGIAQADYGNTWVNYGAAITKDLIASENNHIYTFLAGGYGTRVENWLVRYGGVNVSSGIGFAWRYSFIELGMSFTPRNGAGNIDLLPGLGFGLKLPFGTSVANETR